MSSRLRSPSVFAFLLALIVVFTLTGATALGRGAPPKVPKPKDAAVSVADISFLDLVTFETGYEFAGTEVGGLSSIAYDSHRDVYYVLSDDRSENAPSRFYTVAIDVTGHHLEVQFLEVTYLRDKKGNLYGEREIDPEGLELVRPGQLYISTEGDGDSSPPTDPFINRYNPVGRQTKSLELPGKFLYSVDDGNQVRDNLGFESLSASPNDRYLYAATENALLNDGPIATLENGSPARLLVYRLGVREPVAEYVYCVNPIPKAPDPTGGFADHGLVEIQALDNRGTFLTMERSYASGVGNTILLFEASTEGATDVSDITALHLDGCPEGYPEPMNKAFLTDLASLGVDPDNVEGMALGPELPNGSRLLIAVSDNNFNPGQTTQFIALEVELE